MAKNYENSPLKAGGESIYVGLRTPEDDDPQLDPTRQLRSEQTPQSPTASVMGMERSGSAQSLKRPRDEVSVKMENGFDARNGDAQQHASKRPKTEPKSETNGLEDGDGARAVKAEPDDSGSQQAPSRPSESGELKEEDNGSEEGELEE